MDSMERAPFEQIVAKAMALFDKAALCEDEVLQIQLFLNRSKYLESNGWNDKDFDAEEEKLLLITNTDRDTSKYSK